MRIISINKLVKRRVKDMILTLMPDVGYVKVTNSGLVILKKKWWSVQKITTTVTDLLVGVLPEKISEFANNVNRPAYLRVFNEHIATILAVRAYSSSFDICSYVWEQYIKYCVEVPDMVITTTRELAIVSKHSYLPVSTSFSSKKLRSLIELLNLEKKNSNFIEKINKIKGRLPVPRINLSIIAFS